MHIFLPAAQILNFDILYKIPLVLPNREISNRVILSKKWAQVMS